VAQSHHCVKKEYWQYAIMTDRKTQDQEKFVVRLPNGMRERIKASADRNHRSMNAEIVATLNDRYPEPLPENVNDQAARILLWLAARIRRRKPKPGSVRDKQAILYEGIAADIALRMQEIETTKKR
jgi:hypothetical protein